MPETSNRSIEGTCGAKPGRAVFLDLNGTLVLPLKPESLDELTMIPGADVAIMRLLAADFLCPIVTVQARIEKGLFTESAFRAWFADFFGNLRLDVKGPYICPHRYNHSCPCEKPNSFLYDQAVADGRSISLVRTQLAIVHRMLKQPAALSERGVWSELGGQQKTNFLKRLDRSPHLSVTASATWWSGSWPESRSMANNGRQRTVDRGC